MSTTATTRGAVAIAGGGLIGTSLALALAERGWAVRIHDRDPAVREELEHVLRDVGRGDGSAEAGAHPSITVGAAWPEVARDADVVVAAVPPSAIPGILVEAAPVADPRALLTDVAGTKQEVVAATVAALAGTTAASRFVGGHPMAGSERSGPGAADDSLFSGVTWLLTPSSETDDASLAAAGELVGDLGARVLVLGAEEHDHIVGLVSHLPQLVASVLTDVAAEAVGAERDAVMAVAGPGFRDTTRIAASDSTLWLDIVAANRPAIARALHTFSARLGEVVAAVDAGDDETLGTVLRRAGAARRRLVPKALADPTADLVVPLRDRPGEIARITVALGSAGINIEDLVMRHATAADRGSLLLRVRADASDRARAVLDAIGVAPVLAGGTGDGAGDGGTVETADLPSTS